MDCSPPGSSVHGISQARILGWVVIPFSRGSSPPRDQTLVSCIAGGLSIGPPGRTEVKSVHSMGLSFGLCVHRPLPVFVQSLSCVQLFATPWTVPCQAPLSMGFSRSEYWSGLPFPSPGIFPTQGLNPGLLHWHVSSLPLSHQGSPHLC